MSHGADERLAIFDIDGNRAWQHECHADVLVENLICITGIADFNELERFAYESLFCQSACEIVRMQHAKALLGRLLLHSADRSIEGLAAVNRILKVFQGNLHVSLPHRLSASTRSAPTLG